MSRLILTPNDADYEQHRCAYINADIRNLYPSEIHVVRSVADVVAAVKRARELNLHIGVRSGGHLYSSPSLMQDSILIDTSHLNRRVEYDAESHEIDFGPAVRVKEVADKLATIGRFFPHGHAPTVAMGGFTLAGGQGMFMRGWGGTAANWVTKMEMVMPDGSTVIASHSENEDLFWAARGSGQAFFGVVTRIWGRTIPARKGIYERSYVFRVAQYFEEQLKFAFDRNREMSKYGTETAVVTFYPEKFDPGAQGEEVKDRSALSLSINISAWADSLEKAQEMLEVWGSVPEALKDCLIEETPPRETSLNHFFEMQEVFNPAGNGEKWQINSIFNDPAVPESELIKATKPVMCDLPTRASVGCIYISDTYPDEKECAFSLPQQYYISTFTGWKDSSLQPYIYDIMSEKYQRLQNLACGMYVADFDRFDRRQAGVKVMTDSALRKFLKIRDGWDPENRFPSYTSLLPALSTKERASQL